MGQIYMDDQDVLQDEKAVPVNSNNDIGLKENRSDTAASEHTEFEKVAGKHSLILDVKRPDNSQRCSQNTRPCSDEPTILDHISFSSLGKDLAQYCGVTEYEASDSPNIFHRTASFFKIPVNLRSIEFFMKSLKRHRRIKSTNYTVECTLEAGTGNLILNPLGQWVFDSMERTAETGSLMKSSLVSHLVGATVCSTSSGRAISFNLAQTNSSELTSSPSGLCRNLAEEPETNIIHLEKWNSEFKNSDKMLVSCSHTKPTCSNECTSADKCFGSKAQLQCKWKNGTPHFVFTVGDDCCEIYVADPHKIKSSVGEALDYIYLFHSMAGSKTEFRNCGANASDFIGKMKVSSSLIINANRSKIMETKFVLFAANSDHSREMQNSTSVLMKNKGLSKKAGGIFRPSHSPKHKSTCKTNEKIRPQFESFSGELCLNKVSNYNPSDLVNRLESNCTPNLELAAIIIKDYQHDSSIETAIGGWGLKFLEKTTVSHADSSLEPSLSSESSEENHGRNGGEPAKRLNVLVPAGFHGGPITRIGGPSSLIERWRSGGLCDCGGWDIGCPLTVLNNNNNNSIHLNSLPLEEQREDCKSVNLFIEGTRHRKPVLKMVDMNDGRYFVYFQSSLLALQSFSIALSIIHSQIPALYQQL
ncbi:uncharacterized protein LOC103711850 [Phoenix dactylifera]|uniref:Uncharacterized protein LOC103711850 n=1 Tax=Phoenix dactylifera TaxID=42345 RepID=A0A8B7CCM0_PHODC|nr:uncharacterized protein LOC103711850 [Phoenix dactylifera]